MTCDDTHKNKHLTLGCTLLVPIENIAKTVFFRRFLGNVICQRSYFNAPHTYLTLDFLAIRENSFFNILTFQCLRTGDFQKMLSSQSNIAESNITVEGLFLGLYRDTMYKLCV